MRIALLTTALLSVLCICGLAQVKSDRFDRDPSSGVSADGQDVFTNKTLDGNNNSIQQRRAANDCTAETGGKEGELCLELNDETLYACQPTAGDCDSAQEWILTSTGIGGGSSFWSRNTTGTTYLYPSTDGDQVWLRDGSNPTTEYLQFAYDGTQAIIASIGGNMNFERNGSAKMVFTSSSVTFHDDLFLSATDTLDIGQSVLRARNIYSEQTNLLSDNNEVALTVNQSAGGSTDIIQVQSNGSNKLVVQADGDVQIPELVSCGISTDANGTLSCEPDSGSPSRVLVAASNSAQSVKNAASFVADGIDDHVQIQSAISSLSSTGGTIELSQGTFVVDTINMEPNIYIVGQGIGATTIQLEAGDSKSRVIDFDADSNSGLTDLTIDSNGNNNTNQSFDGLRGVEIHNGSNNVYLSRTEIKNSGGSNYKIYGAQNVNITDCIANGTGNGHSGPQWGSNIDIGANNATTKNIRIDGCYVTGGFRSGVGIRAGVGDTEDIIVTSNHFYQNNQNNETKGEIQVEVGARLKNLIITGNTIEMDSTKNSIGFAMIGNDVDGMVFSSNVIRGMALGAHRGIQLQDAGGVGNSNASILITGNTLIGEFSIGVYVLPNSKGQIVNNDFAGASASQFWNLPSGADVGEGLWIDNNGVGLTQTETCPDSGDVSQAAHTVIPYTKVVSLIEGDPEGCILTISKAGAQEGRQVIILSPEPPLSIIRIQWGSNHGLNFIEDWDATEGATLSLIFTEQHIGGLTDGIWIELSRSFPL